MLSDDFSTGFRIEPMPGIMEKLKTPEEKQDLQNAIEDAERKLSEHVEKSKGKR